MPFWWIISRHFAVQLHLVEVAPSLNTVSSCLDQLALPSFSGEACEEVVDILDELNSSWEVFVDVRDEDKDEEQDWTEDAALDDASFLWFPFGEDVTGLNLLLAVGEIDCNPCESLPRTIS